MTSEQRIKAFNALGTHIRQISPEGMLSLIESAKQENPWFTAESIQKSLKGIVLLLDEQKLSDWIKHYPHAASNPKTVALVMAGNIPLVGFHDLLCVLISGHHAQIKLSSKDSKLLPYLIKHLLWLEPGFEKRISIVDKLQNFDAVVATGSDNSARYFHQYFGKYPHIIRKNRTSIGILTGTESKDELIALGEDVFSYFGLGCRNVSKIFVPVGYEISHMLDAWAGFKEIIHHNKYCNNYDYQKSILLVNRIPFLDNGFILLQENERLVSPISVLYYEQYKTEKDLHQKIETNRDKIQCVVGSGNDAYVPFGQAQYPSLGDYADQIDTLRFLSELN